ncbi:hypothetical protein BGZ81_002284 [Podila clonocystis]|nr:hypothetical protein BGZ81_002284 [Podila clonocystis]
MFDIIFSFAGLSVGTWMREQNFQDGDEDELEPILLPQLEEAPDEEEDTSKDLYPLIIEVVSRRGLSLLIGLIKHLANLQTKIDLELPSPSPSPSPSLPSPSPSTIEPAPDPTPSLAPSQSAPPPPSSPPTSSEQPPVPSEQPPTTTEEHPATTPAPEPITSQQPSQEPVETPPPVNPSSSDDGTPSHTGATDDISPTAGTPGTKPSTLPESKDESGGNKTSITIGVVIAAILIATGIGVWVFRKWKLSPSRQFKSKIRSGSVSGSGAAAAVGSGHGDNPSEYNSYDNIFRPQPHESTMPMTMAGAAAPTGVSMMGGIPANEYEHYEYEYPTQPPMAHPGYHHQAQMSMSSAAGSVTDYGQYRYPPSTTSMGYDPAAVAHSMTAHGGGSPNGGHHLHGYGSQDYSQNDQFLRELRE